MIRTPDSKWPQLLNPYNSLTNIKEINPFYINHNFVNDFREICDEIWKSYFE